MSRKPLSRVLVKVLRHSAKSNGLKIDDEGFIDIQDILDHHLFSELDHDALKEIVANDQKSRFEIKDNKIRASQGHSIPLDLSYPVYNNTELPLFHGTFNDKLNDIKRMGLSKMNRNYIHLTNDLNAVSGIRSDCEILIHINIKFAINGKSFYD